jgi:glycerol-3-phosphate cytidylyltransferase
MKVLEYSDKESIKKTLIGKKVVLVGGCFDILHFGHIKFLKEAKKQGDFLVVALESDNFIRDNKKKEPFHSIEERAQILSSIFYVDLVIKLPRLRSDKDYFELSKFIKPSVIAVSKNDQMYGNKQKMADLAGGEIRVVTDIVKNFSSTKALNYASILGNKSSR